jgi:ATP-dependent DNA helicase RecG
MSATKPRSATETNSRDLPVEGLDGVGATRGRALRLLGVATLRDLIEYFPRDYQFESSERPIEGLVPDQIQSVRGTISAVNYVPARPRPRFEATLSDGPHRLSLVWFHGAYLRRTLHPGLTIRVRGKVAMFRNIPQMANPTWQIVDDTVPAIEDSRFRAVYPATADLASERIERLVSANLDRGLEEIEEWFTADLLARHDLLPRREAWRCIHQPRDLTEAARARRRLVYDELMLMQLGLGMSKRLRDGRLSAPVMRIDRTLDQRIRARFPFELTPAQENATYEIVRDLKSGRPMNRLLQGDVGSGKTAVALYAMLVAVTNKMQAAILAPTEVLAEQHYLTLSSFLRESSVSIELFTGRTKRAGRKTLQKQLADGQVHIAIGTQALIQPDMAFANLGLVVVDEQHKLGVRQRATLHAKGLSPHYLVMTATPIPRTLALSYFADFDLSVIDQLPPGRHPIQTRWLRPGSEDEAWSFVREQVKAGRQAYVVVPQIDDDGLEEVGSVTRELKRLLAGPLAGLRLAALHGQMETHEKQQTMLDFRDHRIDVLVATTVIEVGIDVANATVMLIENADRFGLSQLHQLRGRVGRGPARSHCILVAEAATEAAEERLKAMCRTTDGFKIAEMDLELRGPGHFFGTRQHGLPELKMADLSREIALLHECRKDALELLSGDPRLAHPEHAALKAALVDQFGTDLGLAQVG